MTPSSCTQFQSTPSVWRETHCRPAHQTHQGISIHSLRVEGDSQSRTGSGKPDHFNPLPPCGGRRAELPDLTSMSDFNPLPPCGGRHNIKRGGSGKNYFNPLPPCGGRPPSSDVAAGNAISIHSLRVEGDHCRPAHQTHQGISIHSLRVEGDH